MYKNSELFETVSSEEKTSEILPKIFEGILNNYKCSRVFFAKGPGSFMAIKITYVFLRSLSILKDIELFATDGFYFSGQKPIKAIKKMYFVKENDRITTKFFEQEPLSEFFLPQKIELASFSKDIEPLYILPAV